MKYFLCGCLAWGLVIGMLFCLRPQSKWHMATLETASRRNRLAALSVLILTILICILPMGLSPYWNGEIPDHRNQYELLTESMLNGHLYIDYGDIDPKLLEMENPYDPAARDALGVSVHWDHAFYDGHYYMYFGVVPVFLLFLPFRLLTGMSLTTYHATQVFVAAFICAVFATFAMLAKRFFSKLTFVMYLLLSAAFSMMSVWYSVSMPAMYCTAITAGLCMGMWNLFFFIRAVWVEKSEKRQILWAFFGSLFGALAFGCRPSLALSNLLVIPMLIEYLRGKKPSGKLIGQLALAASPYAVIAALLMLYNAARFGSPFEFGQAYQLTLADQHTYSSLFSTLRPDKIINGILDQLISYEHISDTFPYLSFSGAFVNFPILFFIVIGLTQKPVRDNLKACHLGKLIVLLLVVPLIITVVDILWAPFLMERYRMDIYWLMGLLCFTVIGFSYQHLANGTDARAKRNMSCLAALGALATIGLCILFFLAPCDANYTWVYPEKLTVIQKVLRLGF